MNPLFLVALVTLGACCTNKQQTSNKSSSAEIGKPGDTAYVTTVPTCIDSLIKVFKAEDVQNPPRKIYRYTYNNKNVYYVPAICCDFYSDLYDGNCTLFSHPDGGITGKGSGNTPDFHSTKKNEQLIWEDKRKP